MFADAALIAVAVVYAITSLLLFVFGLNLIAFSLRVWKRGPRSPQPTKRQDDDALPTVTVQLPVYNELYVTERIIDAVCAFDYPHDRLQIQVLDDSTDETTEIVARAVASARSRGLNISHVHRRNRTGYKAGALAAGTKLATGEFLAIFDADFVPPADFLRRTVGEFADPSVAFVQARWGHLNREHSWLTRLQALAIDGHFLVEQAGRGDAGYWFNFNGTAGVWRRTAIDDAGGWKADTLTEDLDLSYRAHLRGWRGAYVEDLVVDAEVPAQLSGFRRQQHRWARGSLQCASRLLPQVWRSESPFMVKMQASLHLCAYFIQLLLLMLLIIYPGVIAASMEYPRFSTLAGIAYLFALSSFAPTAFFITGSRQGGRVWWRDLPRILMITVLGSGLMVNTARAALQIFTRPNPTFERTAKFGLDDESDSWRLKRYQLDTDRIVWVELLLAFYGMFAVWLAWQNANWGVLVYAVIFTTGLLMVSLATLSHSVSLWWSRRARARALEAEVVAIRKAAEPLVA